MEATANNEEEQREFVLPSKGMSVIEEQKKKAVRERARINRTLIGYDSSTDTSEKGSYLCDEGPESCRSETSIASRISEYSRKSALRRTPNVVATGHRNHSGISQNLDLSELKQLSKGGGGDVPDEGKYRQSPSFHALEKKLSCDATSRPMSSHGYPSPEAKEMQHEPLEKRPASSRAHRKGSDLSSPENTARTFTFSGRSTPKYIPRSSVESSNSLFAEVSKIDWRKVNESNEKIFLKKAKASASVSSYAPSITSVGAESILSGISETIDWVISDQQTKLKENENEDSDATITEEDPKNRTFVEESLEFIPPIKSALIPDLESESNLDLDCDGKSDSSEDGAQIRPKTSASSREAFSTHYPSKSDYGISSGKPRETISGQLYNTMVNDRPDMKKVELSTYNKILKMFLKEEDNQNVEDNQNSALEKFLKEKSILTEKFYNMQQIDNEIFYNLASNHIMDNLEGFALHPVPPGFIMRCRIFRDRRGIDKTVFHPYYYLHLERDDGRKNLLMVSRKKKKSATSYYVITTDPSNISSESEAYTGKLRSNLLGTNFTVYDGLTSYKQLRCFEPMDPRPTQILPCREELATVFYETNLFGFKGPRKMSVVIPKMLSNAARMEIRPAQKTHSMMEMIKRNDSQNLHQLKNKTPAWNADNQSYVLNFHGRVTQASVKNFKLVTNDSDGYCILQFGRISEDVFNMDFGYPLCPLQAFSIVLSSFDSKLACE